MTTCVSFELNFKGSSFEFEKVASRFCQIQEKLRIAGIDLKRKFRYKRTSPSHIRHNEISILIKNYSTLSHSDLLPKESQNKNTKTNKQT